MESKMGSAASWGLDRELGILIYGWLVGCLLVSREWRNSKNSRSYC